MAVVTLKSTAVTNANATPRVQNPAGIQNGVVKRSQGFAVITSGDSANSVYRIGKVRSSDYIDDVFIKSADIGTTTTCHVGLHDLLTHTNGGTAVDANFFADTFSLKDGAVETRVTFQSGAAGGLYTNSEKRVWEALGLSADPHKEYDLTLTLVGAADASGTVLVKYYYV